ncbi:citrate lyase subunit beta [Choiromyces venosus 120613-1]|uniref:Citrate lyase subunit beta n=1 Tax=Choiromyces venosus 120613-1 TaxID=1336337 RepID=A0A3N4J7T8_9PEZI|nr:citrate lyase subunit beta [Choiromyces venosus 120613-1]
MATAPILRRALLYVPGSSKRMVEKARGLNVDCVTYDLEDAVTAAEKPTARHIIKDALNLPMQGGAREVSVRINAVETGLALEDLGVVLQGKNLDTIVVPKVESAGDLEFVSNVLDHSNHLNKSSIKILALLESARSIIDIRQIITSTPRLSGLIFAAEDFAKDLSITRTPSLTEFLFARQTITTAARAFNLPSAIDLVCTSYRDTAALERECLDGVGMGFNGKQVIHPSQVDLVQRLFLPGEEQVRGAVRVLVAEKVAEAEGKGSWGLDGRMVDRPVIEAARRVVGKMEVAGMDIRAVWEAEKRTRPE